MRCMSPVRVDRQWEGAGEQEEEEKGEEEAMIPKAVKEEYAPTEDDINDTWQRTHHACCCAHAVYKGQGRQRATPRTGRVGFDGASVVDGLRFHEGMGDRRRVNWTMQGWQGARLIARTLIRNCN